MRKQLKNLTAPTRKKNDKHGNKQTRMQKKPKVTPVHVRNARREPVAETAIAPSARR